ncbi:MAG: hypothetical protein AAF934_05255 [Bacteroidota bacterium]
MKKTHKNNIAFLLLFLFLALKGTNLHAIDHLFDIDPPFEQCECCEHFVLHDNSPLAFFGSHNDILQDPVLVFPKVMLSYTSIFKKNKVHKLFFNRPPPSITFL